LSHERIVDTLVRLGLSCEDARVYIYLATEGPQKTEALAEALKMRKQQLSSSLSSLQRRGIVDSTLEHLVLFSAVPLETVLELLVRIHSEETQNLQQNKNEILARWRTMIRESEK
jgi:sugar-specific transcriptional regulator TrmB